ncbi:hypothetical protein [Providencia sp. SP181]|uniref:hypothetical protein n=1 Tax=Providencia sp. SP181 TaxID=3136277 RepID=UPI003D29A52F
MEMPFLVSSVYLNNIQYINGKAFLTISLNGVNNVFIAYPEDGEISVMRSSDELSKLLMHLSQLLMHLSQYESSIYKKIFTLVWDYVKGKDVILPAKLL